MLKLYAISTHCLCLQLPITPLQHTRQTAQPAMQLRQNIAAPTPTWDTHNPGGVLCTLKVVHKPHCCCCSRKTCEFTAPCHWGDGTSEASDPTSRIPSRLLICTTDTLSCSIHRFVLWRSSILTMPHHRTPCVLVIGPRRTPPQVTPLADSST